MLIGPDVSRERPDEAQQDAQQNVGQQRPFGRPAPTLNPAHINYVCCDCEVFWRGEKDNIAHRKCWACGLSKHTTKQSDYQSALHPTNDMRREHTDAWTDMGSMDDGTSQQEQR